MVRDAQQRLTGAPEFHDPVEAFVQENVVAGAQNFVDDQEYRGPR